MFFILPKQGNCSHSTHWEQSWVHILDIFVAPSILATAQYKWLHAIAPGNNSHLLATSPCKQQNNYRELQGHRTSRDHGSLQGWASHMEAARDISLKGVHSTSIPLVISHKIALKTLLTSLKLKGQKLYKTYSVSKIIWCHNWGGKEGGRKKKKAGAKDALSSFNTRKFYGSNS